MLTAKLLDLAFEVLQMVRADLPQFVVSGDPMQLGAVGAETEGAFHDSGLVKGLRAYVLAESFRQAEDSTFLRILNRARLGKAREADVLWLRANICPKVDAAAPRLFCRNFQTGEYNDLKLDQLVSVGLHIYRQQMAGDVPPYDVRFGEGNTLHLKPGARVLLNRNLPGHPSRAQRLVRHRRVARRPLSALVDFDAGGSRRRSRFVTTGVREGTDNDVVGSRTDMPLILAWAVEIHRAQGATLDSMAVDLSKCLRGKGHAYVALSRVREASHAQVAWAARAPPPQQCRQAGAGLLQRVRRAVGGRAPKRHRERERQAERDAYDQGVDDAALSAMMDAFEAKHSGRV